MQLRRKGPWFAMGFFTVDWKFREKYESGAGRPLLRSSQGERKMKPDARTREEKLLDLLNIYEDDLPRQLDWYTNRHHKVNCGSILAGISTLHQLRGIKGYFIDHNPNAMRQDFYTASILLKIARDFGLGKKFHGIGIPLEDFLYALLSDSPECIDQISHAELEYKDSPKSYHFYTHMLQLLLRDDHTTIRELIARGSNKCGKPLRDEFASGSDFFSLFLKKDKDGLVRHIQSLIKIENTLLPDREFFSHRAVICTKICWIKGLEVEIEHPLVPMPIMPTTPLNHYKTGYDFLQPGWKPLSAGLTEKILRWVKQF